MIRKPIVLKDGKLHELPSGDSLSIGYGKKLDFHINSLAAYDKVVNITYDDAGLPWQRISQITLSSVLYPNADIVKDIFYLDPGSRYQRIDRIEYTGSIFSTDTLTKTYAYSLVGNYYKIDSISWSLI